MTGTDPATELSELSSKLGNVEAVLNPDALNREADRLKEQAADPGLWGDPERGQAVTRRLSYLEGELGRLAQLHQRLDDPSLYARERQSFDEASAALAATQTELAAAEEKWLQLELLREEIEGD